MSSVWPLGGALGGGARELPHGGAVVKCPIREFLYRIYDLKKVKPG